MALEKENDFVHMWQDHRSFINQQPRAPRIYGFCIFLFCIAMMILSHYMGWGNING